LVSMVNKLRLPQIPIRLIWKKNGITLIHRRLIRYSLLMLLLMLECVIFKIITIRFGFHKGFEEFYFIKKINLWIPRQAVNVYIIDLQSANFHKIWKQLII
jgi:hypothetical protein